MTRWFSRCRKAVRGTSGGPSRRVLLRWVGAYLLTGGLLVAQPANPSVVFRSAPGQFEVIGPTPAASAAVVELARRAWAQLRGPLSLPEAFSSAVVVRLVPVAEWNDRAVFRAIREPGGVVTLRVAWRDELQAEVVRRGLVQALLLRQAVARRGGEAATVPLWLERGAVAWWVTRDNPAMLEAWQQDAAQAAPVRLTDLWSWRRGEAETRNRELAALWWFSAWWEAEGTRPGRGRALLGAVLGGEDPAGAVGRLYPEFGDNEAARERWWRVAVRAAATERALPWWTAELSRLRLRENLRVVLTATDGSGERRLAGADLRRAGAEPVVRAEIKRRLAQLGVGLPRVHPFYRNAVISAGSYWEAALRGDEAALTELESRLITDIELGRELEETTGEALDAINALGG